MYKGKIIYNPKPKAAEYSKWAANFYNGCSGNCTYCYLKDPPLNQFWSTTPKLKKSLINEWTAYEIFIKEIKKNKKELQKDGLFFNFNSDPFLKSTYYLNHKAIIYCQKNDIPVKISTKQTWWLDKIVLRNKNISVGFTLTGHDELEPGCATNAERIQAIKTLKERGYKTWASIEPIIKLENSREMIMQCYGFCDHFKIGLKSKTKYNIPLLQNFIKIINNTLYDKKIYWKDSLLKQAGINRQDLPSNCVDRDFF